MESKNEKTGLNPETSWPQMEQLLDHHFASKRKRRVGAWLFLGVVSIGAMLWVFKGATWTKKSVSEKPTSVVPVAALENSSNATAVPKYAATNTQPRVYPEKSVKPTIVAVSAATENNKTLIGATSSRKDVPSSTSSSSPRLTQSVKRNHPSKMVAAQTEDEANALVTSDSHHLTSKIATVDSSIPVDPAVTAADNLQQEQPLNATPVVSSGVEKIMDHELVTENFVSQNKEVTTTQNPEKSVEPSPVGIAAPALAASVEQKPSEEKVAEEHISSSRSTDSLKKSGRWVLAADAGWFAAEKSISSNDPEWNLRRTSEETNALLGNYQLSVVREFSHWNIGAGIGFSQWGDKVDYTAASIRQTIVDHSYWTYRLDSTDTLYLSGNQYLLHDPTPQVVDSGLQQLFDTVTGLVAEPSLAGVHVVRWQYLELPVSVGFSVHAGKWGFGIAGTVAPAWLYDGRGDYIKFDQSGLIRNTDLAAVNRFQLSVRLGLQVAFEISDCWSLALVPQWRRQLRSVYKEETGINQRYTSLGASFGIRYRLK